MLHFHMRASVVEEGTKRMHGFYWLIEGMLAGCPRPGGRDRSNLFESKREALPEEDSRLDNDLAWLKEQGIRAVLSLTETPLAPAVLARHDLAALHLPVQDM